MKKIEIPMPPITSMLVDLYDSSASPQWCLIVLHGTSPPSVTGDVRAKVSSLAPLALRVEGITLCGLVDSMLAHRLANRIARYGGALLSKEDLMASVPDGLTRDDVTPP